MKLLLLCILLCVSGGIYGAEFKGMNIVVGEKPTVSTQLAALELQYHIKMISGQNLPITAKSVSGQKSFLLGESFKPKMNLTDEEHAVVFENGCVFLLGKDAAKFDKVNFNDMKTYPCLFENHGTLNAVYDFLEKVCGVRWYLPTEFGIAYEKMSGFDDNQKNIRRKPSIEHRSQNYSYRLPKDLITDTGKDAVDPGTLDWSEQQLWLFRQRIGGKKYVANHSLAAAYLPGAVKTHPEWFKIAKHANNAELFDFTDRRVPKQICFSNADFRNYYIGLIDQYFKKDYNNNGCNAPCHAVSYKVDGENSIIGRGNCVSITPDDFNPECCEACAKLKDTSEKAAASGLFLKGIYTPLVWTIVNNYAKGIKKIHPEAVVSALAYQGYAHVPAFEIEDNVVPMLTLSIRNTYSIQTQKHESTLFDAWIAKMGDRKLYVWLYYTFPIWNANSGKYRSFPGFTAKKVGGRVKEMIQKGIDGIFMESGEVNPYYRDIAMSHLEEYITWRIADDVTLDPNQLFDEFFVRFYGSAAKPMQELYEYITAIYENPANYPNKPFVHQNEEIAWGSLGTPERMKKIEALLKAGEAAAQTESEKSRVAFFRKNIFDYMKRGVAAFRGEKTKVQDNDFSKTDLNLADNEGNTNFRQTYNSKDKAKIESGLLQISAQGIASSYAIALPGTERDAKKVEKIVWIVDIADSAKIPIMQLAFTADNKGGVIDAPPLVRFGIAGLDSATPYNNFMQSIKADKTQIASDIKNSSTYPLGNKFTGKNWKFKLVMDKQKVYCFFDNSEGFKENADWEFTHNQDFSTWKKGGAFAAIYFGGKVGDYENGLKISKFEFNKE